MHSGPKVRLGGASPDAVAIPDRLVYATTRQEYAEFYRDDRRHFGMETLTAATELIIEQSRLPVEPHPHPRALDVYRLWQELNQPEGR